MIASQLCITTICYHPFTLERALAGIAETGVSAVELAALVGFCDHAAPERLGSNAARELSQLLNRHGLHAVSLSGHADLTVEPGVAAFRARLRLAADMGIPIVNTGAADEEGQEVAERFYRNIVPLAELAAELGVLIGIETHGSLTGTGEECVAVMTRLNHPHVRINYDPANLIFYRGVRPEADIAIVAPYVAHLHVKDKASLERQKWDFPAIGDGIVDWDIVFGELERVGFSGPASLEVELDGHPRSPEEVDQALCRSVKYMQRYITEQRPRSSAPVDPEDRLT
jgi:sugar phosphate isomerase/epimerase